MNIREGMRRLGAVLSVVGAVGGGYLGYLSGIDAWSDAWQTYKDQRTFESVMAMPIAKKVIQAVSSYSGKGDLLDYANGAILPPLLPTPGKHWWEEPGCYRIVGSGVDSRGRLLPSDFVEGGKIVFVNVDGISEVVMGPTGIIASIHQSNGETAWGNLSRVTFPLVPLLYPTLGFLLPWGTIRTMSWIGVGFFQTPR